MPYKLCSWHDSNTGGEIKLDIYYAIDRNMSIEFSYPPTPGIFPMQQENSYRHDKYNVC